MLKREDWLDLARKVDWEYSYIKEEEVFPEIMSGRPWLPHENWKKWNEPYQTSYSEYVKNQHSKDDSVAAVRDAIGKIEDFQKLDQSWINGLKLHAATLPLAEFAAVIGNLRSARFGRDSAWRTMATLGALDELRHTQIPLQIMGELVPWDRQFDWTHKFYHSNNWVAIAAKHAFDELLLFSNAIEFAIATNFVFETGFTNLQFIGLSALAHKTGDRMFEKMVTSIQTDEARHAQIGIPVLKQIVQKDPEYAQYLLDKWFWRSWQLFAVVTGFSMDYFTPVEKRPYSFKEFMQEWVIDQYQETLKEFGLKKPWYWETFIDALDSYHHMVYASAYTYRATVWFDFILPSPEDRKWLKNKYPKYWDHFDSVWNQVDKNWEKADPGNDWAVHGTAIVSFCSLCQIVLCGGTPKKNTANTLDYEGRKYIFCSEPCRWIFEKEPEKYAPHKNLVDRVLAGEAPANLLQMLTQYFNLEKNVWGKDIYGGQYPWIKRKPKSKTDLNQMGTL